jgi:hypothetical protein
MENSLDKYLAEKIREDFDSFNDEDAQELIDNIRSWGLKDLADELQEQLDSYSVPNEDFIKYRLPILKKLMDERCREVYGGDPTMEFKGETT